MTIKDQKKMGSDIKVFKHQFLKHIIIILCQNKVVCIDTGCPKKVEIWDTIF